MARVKGGAPRLDADEVLRFFEGRAKGADPLDHYAVTVFTDREAAEERHLAERDRALKLLGLPDPAAHVLDIGCGGGRWARSVAGPDGRGVASYFGIDFSAALIDLAKAQRAPGDIGFAVLPISDFAGGAPLPRTDYSHVLVVAVSIYLNDEEAAAMLRRAAGLLAPGGIVYLREGISSGPERLTLIEEPSAALNDSYSAVYRTADEYAGLIAEAGLRVVESGPLDSRHFARHAETHHRFFLCARP